MLYFTFGLRARLKDIPKYWQRRVFRRCPSLSQPRVWIRCGLGGRDQLAMSVLRAAASLSGVALDAGYRARHKSAVASRDGQGVFIRQRSGLVESLYTGMTHRPRAP